MFSVALGDLTPESSQVEARLSRRGDCFHQPFAWINLDIPKFRTIRNENDSIPNRGQVRMFCTRTDVGATNDGRYDTFYHEWMELKRIVV